MMTPELNALFDQLEAAVQRSVIGLAPPDLYDMTVRLRRMVKAEIAIARNTGPRPMDPMRYRGHIRLR